MIIFPPVKQNLNRRIPSIILVDDRERKIRYIFLDTGDIPYNVDENGKLKHEGQHDFAFSQKQTDWLMNHALYFEEDGWNLILSAHTTFHHIMPSIT